MGMNYYCISNVCPCCHESKSKKHIGKSSWGWAFLFQSYGFEGPSSYKEWIEELSQSHKLIINEENEQVPLEFLLSLINDNDRNKTKLSSARMYSGAILNVDEMKYMEDKGHMQYFSDDIKRSYYVDEDGYGFCTNDFS